MVSVFVETLELLEEAISSLVSDLSLHSRVEASYEDDNILFCDFEGVDLGRDGELCLGQFATTKHTFIVDFIALKRDALYTSFDGFTLGSILESKAVYKVVFDPRNDSEAVYHQFGVLMGSVICLQNMWTASFRQKGKSMQYNTGLTTILVKGSIPGVKGEEIAKLKEEGRNWYNENPAIWRKRPVPDSLLQYSIKDVIVLIPLYNHLKPQLNEYWMKLVLEHSEKRVLVCLEPDVGWQKAARFAPSF